jgi:PAS domain S-box-containing protein/putative nucleotidyltransferase with HDIG domain
MNNREYTSPGTAKELFIAFNEVYKTGIPLKSKDFKIIWKDNSRSTLELSVSLIRDQKGDPTGFRGIARDVTGKRYFEHMYRTIADQSFSGVYIIQKGVFQYINSSAAVRAGYTPEELIGGESMKIIHPDDRETTKQISDEMLKGVRKSPYVYRMITKDHTIRWIIETVKPIIFQGEQAILGNSMDITELKQAEEALTNSFISLRTALGATLQAIAIFVETRDPSTIGHQRRVSDLARAIATEMDMTKDHIEGVRMAGMIHDIGKISIPAEILRKPTKLTGNEIRLIRDHSQAGYDILKDIEFPWPIARMVLEHHERIDGSGYPQGLKRDDTLLESRILAVADVVEAMVSPRPSRPALGLDKALDEIMRNRDILYDTSVADACLHLFKEKNYKIVD